MVSFPIEFYGISVGNRQQRSLDQPHHDLLRGQNKIPADKRFRTAAGRPIFKRDMEAAMDSGSNCCCFSHTQRDCQLSERRQFIVATWGDFSQMIVVDRGRQTGSLLRVGDFSHDVAGDDKPKTGMRSQERTPVDCEKVH